MAWVERVLVRGLAVELDDKLCVMCVGCLIGESLVLICVYIQVRGNGGVQVDRGFCLKVINRLKEGKLQSGGLSQYSFSVAIVGMQGV